MSSTDGKPLSLQKIDTKMYEFSPVHDNERFVLFLAGAQNRCGRAEAHLLFYCSAAPHFFPGTLVEPQHEVHHGQET